MEEQDIELYINEKNLKPDKKNINSFIVEWSRDLRITFMILDFKNLKKKNISKLSFIMISKKKKKLLSFFFIKNKTSS
jgi:hypothetical protein